ncbi:MAG: methylated-DNA--[protein]-cysteine S-methyltransferase [Theionarchaea archaeon]|nr:methylated-DNA--[protein]-cysteine S-methyltransferase [Theionarchaea archaeon]
MGKIHEWIPSKRLETTIGIWADGEGNVETIEFTSGYRRFRGSYRLPVSSEILEYLEGKRKVFSPECVDVRIEKIRGHFHRNVLRKAMEIPYGSTVAYSELADSLDSRAWRAVGSAMARNPVPIVVPCHRVVAKHGIGGFGGNVELKRRLLELEGADLP